MGYDTTTMWGWGVGMMLLMPLFWVFVIAAVVWLIVRVARPEQSASTPGQGTALRILEERLARGEIDVEEFRARKIALEQAR